MKQLHGNQVSLVIGVVDDVRTISLTVVQLLPSLLSCQFFGIFGEAVSFR
jgi:hypothetical protein